MTITAATGGDGTLTHSVTGLPSELSFNSTTLVISGTLSSDQTINATYKATDSDATDKDSCTSDFTITINPQQPVDKVPTCPSISNKSGTVGTAVNIELPVATGGDGTLSCSVTNLPSGLSFDCADREIEGTPTTVQTKTVTYTATDSDATNPDSCTEEFTITITPPPPPPNNPPTFDDEQSTTRSVAENTIRGVNVGAPVSATDEDPNDTIRYSITSPNPALYDVTIFDFNPETGQLSTKEALNYEAPPNTNDPQPLYRFIVTASDNHGATASINLIVQITDVNEPPVKFGEIEDQLLNPGDSPVEIDLSHKFHDPDRVDTPTYSVTSSNTVAVKATETNGKLMIVPDDTRTGTATITVSARDPREPDWSVSQQFEVVVFTLKLTRKYAGTIEPPQDVEWTVMEGFQFAILPSPNIQSGYQFQAIVPHETGLQVPKPGMNCNWGNKNDTESPWVTPVNSIFLASCGVETENAKIELRMRKNDDDGDGFMAGETGSVGHPWHRKDRTIMYYMEASTLPKVEGGPLDEDMTTPPR